MNPFTLALMFALSANHSATVTATATAPIAPIVAPVLDTRMPEKGSAKLCRSLRECWVRGADLDGKVATDTTLAPTPTPDTPTP